MLTPKWIATALICVSAAVLVGRAQEAGTPPTSPTGSIRGKVTIKSSALFARPDVSRVVVYVASSEQLDRNFGPTTRAVVAQRDKTFIPNFLVVPRGTQVEFPNWDHFDHNVFSKSAAAPEFDLERYNYGQSKMRTFEKLGVVQVFCNIHPGMRAIIYVTPNRLWGRPDQQGNFQIEGVPTGTYELVAWNDRCEEQRQMVSVGSEQAAEVSFALRESRDRVLNSTENRDESYGVERGLGVKRERLNLPIVRDEHPASSDSRP